MVARLVGAGFAVRGYDVSPEAAGRPRRSASAPVLPPPDAADAFGFLVTMLLNGRVVREAMLGTDGTAPALAPD